ncbi:MAG: glycosyltransferase [Planctomycetota bacterium]
MTIRAQQRTDPLTVQFVVTSLPVGGAEVLLLNLVQAMDWQRFRPEVICLKEPGEMGPQFSEVVPVHANLLYSKGDLLVVPRLAKLVRSRKTDALITVGAGDKMFWGRLAAKMADLPVICSALHSTGWPDGVGKLNRLLTPLNDGFIACAQAHAEHLSKYEHFPRNKVFAIPNGVDTDRFMPDPESASWLRSELRVSPQSKLVGIVAALREEKNHAQFIKAALHVLKLEPDTQFVIVGDGPEAKQVQELVLNVPHPRNFHLLGNRQDTPRILAGLDVFCLTSKNEANPVSILEALACEVPVVAPNVGSVHETVIDGETGFLTEPFSSKSTAKALLQLLQNQDAAAACGQAGRKHVICNSSLQVMVNGYQQMLVKLYNQKAEKRRLPLVKATLEGLPSTQFEGCEANQPSVRTDPSLELVEHN